jgi:hypothetical protein
VAHCNSFYINALDHFPQSLQSADSAICFIVMMLSVPGSADRHYYSRQVMIFHTMNVSGYEYGSSYF